MNRIECQCHSNFILIQNIIKLSILVFFSFLTFIIIILIIIYGVECDMPAIRNFIFQPLLLDSSRILFPLGATIAAMMKEWFVNRSEKNFLFHFSFDYCLKFLGDPPLPVHQTGPKSQAQAQAQAQRMRNKEQGM